jgi:hypothetical protein
LEEIKDYINSKLKDTEVKILKTEYRDKIKIVSKDIWLYFKALYNGGPEIRRTIFDHDNFDIFYYKINLKIILKLDNSIEEQPGKPLKIYISQFKTILDLYFHIYELIHSEIKFTDNIFIRLWKFNENNSDKFDTFVKENKPAINSSELIEFPGSLYDCKLSFNR